MSRKSPGFHHFYHLRVQRFFKRFIQGTFCAKTTHDSPLSSGHGNSPSQKGHDRRIARVRIFHSSRFECILTKKNTSIFILVWKIFQGPKYWTLLSDAASWCALDVFKFDSDMGGGGQSPCYFFPKKNRVSVQQVVVSMILFFEFAPRNFWKMMIPNFDLPIFFQMGDEKVTN